MLRKKNITCNKAKMTGREQLKKGDKIQVFFSGETLQKFMEDPEVLKVEYELLKTLPMKGIQVVYEDEDEKVCTNIEFSFAACTGSVED